MRALRGEYRPGRHHFPDAKNRAGAELLNGLNANRAVFILFEYEVTLDTPVIAYQSHVTEVFLRERHPTTPATSIANLPNLTHRFILFTQVTSKFCAD